MLDRDLLEVLRQLRRGKGPGAVEARRAEPAPGDQEVEGAVAAHPEHVGFGVVHPEQGRRPGDGDVADRPLEQDELGRRRADEHLRRRLGVELLARQGRLDVLPVVVGRQLGEAVRQLAGHRGPRSDDARGLQPRGVVAHVEGLARLVLEQIPVGVQGIAEVDVLDRAPDRVAVEVDQHRRRRRREHQRRIGLDALGLLHLQRAVRRVGEEPVEVEHPLVLGQRLDVADQRLHDVRAPAS